MQSGFDINKLFREAQTRWLKPAEVLYILQNHEKHQIIHEPPQKPASGSVLLFDKRVNRFFRKDGHSWRKKKDGRTVGEAHERLKVGNVETLNCYYAHGEQNPNFQRRSYWMLDTAHDHIVLVHYREINEGKPSPGSMAKSPGLSSAFSPSPKTCTPQNPGSDYLTSDVHEPSQNFLSPAYAEVSSDLGIKNHGVDNPEKHTSSADLDVSQALRRIEEQLSLDEDSTKDIGPFCIEDGVANDLDILEYGKEIPKQQPLHGRDYTLQDQLYTGYTRLENYPNNFVLPSDRGETEEHYQRDRNDHADGSKDTLYWKNVLESCEISLGLESQRKLQSFSRRKAVEQLELFYWSNFKGSNSKDSFMLPQEVENVETAAHSSVMEALETNLIYCRTLFSQGQIGTLLATDSNITIAEKQKFTIREISPDWGYSTEATKVLVVGSFLCDPSESVWTCMFGETEVPLEILQEGVICCEAPPHHPGKVNLCITCGNRESCSEVREFEYRVKTSSSSQYNLYPTEAKSTEELLLLVRFLQMLLSDSPSQQGCSTESGIHLLRKLKDDDDSWNDVIEALLVGNGTSSGIIDWLLQELLKDKLQQWLSSRSKEACNQSGCSLSKKEQGIIHMVAGLGFEWALNPILSHGVSTNFRDINGWTALHWAACFGREKMVATLIASGASAGAVTDPTSQDPTGKTAASIAASNGHKGLAGYLSELALTSHLSSLTLEESELSKGSAEVMAEMTVNSISKVSTATSEDKRSLKDTLAAVRNAALAAARIHNAFRALSFEKRRQREAAAAAAAAAGVDEYGLHSDEIQRLSAMSKLTFGNARDYNSAALSIQKKYRGWKGRKNFLALRRKVVKIQAHVRGYQVRKQYKVVCRAVSILEKIILRWRRKGVGLRGFHPETEPNDSSEDEDFLRVFRKQKVYKALDEALSRVLNMAESPKAREQYRRMLERYLQAKAKLGDTSEPSASISVEDISDMENDDFF